MPGEEEIPAAAASRRAPSPVPSEQVIDHIISIDDFVSYSTATLARLPKSGKEHLLAALEVIERSCILNPSSPVSTSVHTESVEQNSVAIMPELDDAPLSAIKAVATSFDQIHLLNGEELAHYRQYIFAAQQTYQNLLAESYESYKNVGCRYHSDRSSKFES